jgi:predicted esterase
MPEHATATSPQHISFDYTTQGRFILHTPPSITDNTLLILTLHGYGSSPEVMFRLSLPTVGDQHILAAIQGPNQAYAAASPTLNAEIGYNWGTRNHPVENVERHHHIVKTVLATLRKQFKIPAARCVLMGFSQPVGFNYRFAGTYPEEVGGVIGICGGVPKNWEEYPYQPTPPLLHIARGEDEFFPAAVVTSYPDRLRKHASDVEFHLLEGGHRYPSKARGIVQPWLKRVFDGQTRP